MVIGATVRINDSGSMLRTDIGFYIKIVSWPRLRSCSKDTCGVGLSEILTLVETSSYAR